MRFENLFIFLYFDFQSFSSSDDDDDEEDEDRRHHLLHVNGELLPDNDDDDTEDSLYEPEIVKVCFFTIENVTYKYFFVIAYKCW